MEENIHIHYRNLRIELSRVEFEEFTAAFGKQSAELLNIIRERNYQNGQLPNANQEDVRIWTESRLDPGENRAPLYARCHAVHNHGDVKPKNVIIDPDGAAWFFDFNYAFHGPRVADGVDGAYEFSLAEKYIHLADFARSDRFIGAYAASSPTPEEQDILPQWIELIGCIKFTEEVRVLLDRPHENLLRRALAIAGFVLALQATTNTHASI